MSRSHLIRFCRWPVRIWRKHGEPQQRVVMLNPTYPYFDPGTSGKLPA